MSGFYKFLSIFETTLAKTAPSKIIFDPIRVEFFSGSRSFDIPIQNALILPLRGEDIIAQNGKLILSNTFKYVSIAVRNKESNRVFFEDSLDRMITNLSLIYGPGLFAKQIYRGWQLEENKKIIEAWVQFQDSFDTFDIIEEDATLKLKTIFKAQNSNDETRERLNTMARFFKKSILLPPSEEKFLYLWTILEIFPMEDTANIRSISQFLSKRIGRDPETIKKKLGIGRLFGIRSDLVNNGYLGLKLPEIGPIFEKLENICIEVFREISGLSYNNSLESFFCLDKSI